MNEAVAIFFSAMNVVTTNVFAPDGLIVPFVLITSLYSTNINEHYLPSRFLMHEKVNHITNRNLRTSHAVVTGIHLSHGGCIHTLRICNTYCFSMAAVITQTRLMLR